MAEELMTREDAEMLAKYSAISPRPFTITFGEAARILATYAECARLRAALTEREGECERLDAANAKLVRDNLKFAVSLVDAQREARDTAAELAALRQRVAELEADTMRVDGAVWAGRAGSLSVLADRNVPPGEIQIRDDSGRVLCRLVGFDAARGPRTGGDSE